MSCGGCTHNGRWCWRTKNHEPVKLAHVGPSQKLLDYLPLLPTAGRLVHTLLGTVLMHRAVVHGTSHIFGQALVSNAAEVSVLAITCLHNSKITCAEPCPTRAATHIHDMWLGAHWGSGEYLLHHICEKQHTQSANIPPMLGPACDEMNRSRAGSG